MLTTFRIGRPVWPFHSPERMRSANADIRSSTSCTSGTTSSPSTTIDAERGARSATCRTARPSVTLMRSPENMASIRSARPRSCGQPQQEADRLVGRPVLGVVEVEPGRLGDHPLAAGRVGREQVAQVRVAHRGRVILERRPGRGLPQRLHVGAFWSGGGAGATD